MGSDVAPPRARPGDGEGCSEDCPGCRGPTLALTCTNRTALTGTMQTKIRTAGVEEARNRLPEIIRAAYDEGAITIVTRRGEPYAAVVPVSQALREAPNLSDLRGSAKSCFGDAGEFVSRMRDEWP